MDVGDVGPGRQVSGTFEPDGVLGGEFVAHAMNRFPGPLQPGDPDVGQSEIIASHQKIGGRAVGFVRRARHQHGSIPESPDDPRRRNPVVATKGADGHGERGRATPLEMCLRTAHKKRRAVGQRLDSG
jgi:hypothetical protein